MNNLKNCILFFLIGLISIWGQSTHSKNICFTETLSQSIISPNQEQLNVQASGIQGITGEGLQINNKINITSGQNKISAGQAAYDELAGALGQAAATSLIGLRKAYESTRLEMASARGKRLNCPLAILRLSLELSTCCRHIAIDGHLDA